MSKHRCEVYNSLERLLEVCSTGTDRSIRYWTRRWKNHVERNGNVPMLIECSICSGRERKADIKAGNWKEGRPVKAVRDELKGDD